MNHRSASLYSAPSGAVPVSNEEVARQRFRLACRMLRNAGHLDHPLPGQRRGESPLDWLVRHGLAIDPRRAAEALIAAKGLTHVLDELMALPEFRLND